MKNLLHLQFNGQSQLWLCIKKTLFPGIHGYSLGKGTTTTSLWNSWMWITWINEETADSLFSWAVKKAGIFLKGSRFKWEHALEKQTQRGGVTKTKGSGYSSLTAEQYKDNRKHSMKKHVLSTGRQNYSRYLQMSLLLCKLPWNSP